MNLLIVIVHVFLSTTLFSNQLTPYIDKAFTEIAKEQGVNVSLLKAICMGESSFRPHVFVKGDGYGQNHAIGICQILISTGEGFGIVDHRCYRLFKFNDTVNNVFKNCKLFGPRTNIRVAARLIKSLSLRYGNDITKIIAAYNAGQVKECRTGVVKNSKGKVLYKCKIGGLLNKVHVDRVKTYYRKFLNSEDFEEIDLLEVYKIHETNYKL